MLAGCGGVPSCWLGVGWLGGVVWLGWHRYWWSLWGDCGVWTATAPAIRVDNPLAGQRLLLASRHYGF